jgi:hypothetical protein
MYSMVMSDIFIQHRMQYFVGVLLGDYSNSKWKWFVFLGGGARVSFESCADIIVGPWPTYALGRGSKATQHEQGEIYAFNCSGGSGPAVYLGKVKHGTGSWT